jgi:hypothetical protein
MLARFFFEKMARLRVMLDGFYKGEGERGFEVA